MALKDFIYVPKVSDFNVGGEMIIVYDNYNPYRVAYQSEDEYTIRAGVYHPGSETFQFVFTSPIAIYEGIDIILQSPYLTVVDRLTEISTPLPGDIAGYYGVINFSKDRMSTNIKNQSNGVKWFDNLHLLYVTLAYGPAPSPSDGVVVTCIASPVTPSNDGVIVTCIAKLADPNQQGGTSVPNGGQGTFNDYSDPIPIPPLPTISASDCGLVTLFRPSKEELQSLGSYLWTNITDFIDNLNKLFMNPMDYLIALNIFPCVPEVGTERPIHIGSFTTSISMPPVTSQWYQYNCGVVSLPEYWGSALDYYPNTKVSLFLPFIGSVLLNTDEVMGNRIGVVYRIDLLSGQCVAMVTVSSLVNQTDSVIYQFTGECSVSVPLTGADWSRVYSAVIGAIGTGVTGAVAAGTVGAAAGGATAALAGANAADAVGNIGFAYSMMNDTSKGVRGIATMREQMLQASQIALDAGRQAAASPHKVAKGIVATRILNTIDNVLGNVMSAKGTIQHSGNVSASAGMLGVKTPYLLVEYPNQSLADNYKHFVGYPSNMYYRLGDLTGYTECEQVIANGLVDQTDSEMAEIIEALKGGVYL